MRFVRRRIAPKLQKVTGGARAHFPIYAKKKNLLRSEPNAQSCLQRMIPAIGRAIALAKSPEKEEEEVWCGRTFPRGYVSYGEQAKKKHKKKKKKKKPGTSRVSPAIMRANRSSQPAFTSMLVLSDVSDVTRNFLQIQLQTSSGCRNRCHTLKKP